MGTVNLKSNLGYVVTNRRGSVTELEEKIGRSAMKEFATVGFIKLGYYNWSKLKLADEYYTNLYMVIFQNCIRLLNLN